MQTEPFLQSHVPGFPCRRGKVRDVYDLGETLAIVATDRISAFDWVMPTGIPEKGRILTAMSVFWFDWLAGAPPPARHRSRRTSSSRSARSNSRAGRCTSARRKWCRSNALRAGTSPVAAGRNTGRPAVCAALELPAGLREAGKLPEPIFTPATKEEGGKHDENISFERMVELVGIETATELRNRTLDVYRRAAAHAQTVAGSSLRTRNSNGADLPSGELILIDEVLTPDSSRYWPAGYVSTRFITSVVRQAVPARLAGVDRLGQEEPSPAAAD